VGGEKWEVRGERWEVRSGRWEVIASTAILNFCEEPCHPYVILNGAKRNEESFALTFKILRLRYRCVQDYRLNKRN